MYPDGVLRLAAAHDQVRTTRIAIMSVTKNLLEKNTGMESLASEVGFEKADQSMIIQNNGNMQYQKI